MRGRRDNDTFVSASQSKPRFPALKCSFFFLKMEVSNLHKLWSISPGIGITLALKLHEFYDSRDHKLSLHLLTQEGKMLLVDY